ncbi:phage tail tape measure protein [Enterobacter sp. A103]|uniref:phage tail tape measure protein n=1 Tax=Enterobacter sp. A103 TaxID=3102785 RepID=UPI002AC9F24C|nr:phage tail tape measure protein [Enterobacter sp. A103]MDZ5641659.1 phage tail tape measure protein [Enterobacter sp. A103]
MKKKSAATKRFLESIDPTLRAFNRLDENVSELHRRFEAGLIPEAQFKGTLALLEQERTELYALSEAAEKAGHKMASGFSTHELAAKKAGISVGQYTMALRTLPMQMTDIVTQLAGGQNPLLILIQQGGQVRDSFGGIRPALGAVAGMLNPVTLGIGALAAAGGVLAYNLWKDHEATAAFSQGLAKSGNYAGESRQSLAALSQELAGFNWVSRDVANTAVATAAGFRLTESQLRSVADAAIATSHSTGDAVDKLVEKFAGMADSPVKALKTLGDSYSFLTPEIVNQVFELDRQGHQAAALKVITDELAKSQRQMGQDAPVWSAQVSSGYEAIAGAAGDAARAQRAAQTKALSDTAASQAGMDDYLNAAIKREAAHTAEERRQFLDEEKQFEDHAATRKRYIDDAARLLKYHVINQAEYAKRVSDINDKYKDPKTPAYHDDEATKRLATLKEQAEVLREQSETLKGTLSLDDRLTESDKKLAAFRAEIAGLTGKKLTAEQRSLLLHQGEIDTQLRLNAAQEKENLIIQAASKLMAEQRGLRLSTDKLKTQTDTDVAGVTLSQKEREHQEKIQSIRDSFAAKQMQLEDDKAQYTKDQYREQTEFLRQQMQEQIDTVNKGEQAKAAAQQDFLGGAMAGMQDWANNQMDLADRARQATAGLFDNMSQSVINFALTGKLNFRSFTAEILKDIARIAMQAAISKAVSAILGSFGGGGEGSTPSGAYDAAAANVSFNALGGVFRSASLGAFSGQVVARPTLFAFAHGAGLMGEAGPEGIFPLRRGADGKLGVVAQMAGAGAPVFAPQYHIAIQNDGQNGQIGPQALQAVYDVGQRAAADYIRNQQRSGGSLGGGRV